MSGQTVSLQQANSSSPDPENLLTMLRTWQNADISQQEPYNGNFEAALKGIKAKALVLPCKHDLYFPYVHQHPIIYLAFHVLTE